jgi:hypothetical protein
VLENARVLKEIGGWKELVFFAASARIFKAVLKRFEDIKAGKAGQIGLGCLNVSLIR